MTSARKNPRSRRAGMPSSSENGIVSSPPVRITSGMGRCQEVWAMAAPNAPMPAKVMGARLIWPVQPVITTTDRAMVDRITPLSSTPSRNEDVRNSG